MNHLMIFVVHETQISHLKFENPIEYGLHLVMASISHTLHFKCAIYLNVIQTDDASDDMEGAIVGGEIPTGGRVQPRSTCKSTTVRPFSQLIFRDALNPVLQRYLNLDKKLSISLVEVNKLSVH